ncbi:MAG: hypothetical protein ACJ749_08280 [Flavisolibacter sp.]
MKFKSLVSTTLVVICFASCSNNSKTVHEETKPDSTTVTTDETIPDLEETFPGLYNYLHLQDSSFSTTGFEGGEIGQKPDSSDRKQDTSGLHLYYPYLLFNSDSSMALDLVSYNYVAHLKHGKTELEEAGPDYEVALIDFKTGRRKQLLFFGTTGTVLDAKWQDANTILMAGATQWKGGDSMLPVLWKYELSTRSWFVFQYERMISADWSGYKKSFIKD